MISVHCLVDNSALRGSTLWGEHGVSFYIETPNGNLLFDTGQSGVVLLHNVTEMNIDLQKCAALALSHAHYDHTGGLECFLQHSQPGIALYASPALFQARYAVRRDQVRSIGLKLAQTELAQRCELHLDSGPLEILPGIWTTGEILDRHEFEGRSAQHQVRADGGWQPDPYQDDLSLVIETGQGLALVCGCCHAGLLNTLAQVRHTFQRRVETVIGGTHLASASPANLDQVIEVLQDVNGGKAPRLYLNHCTGERAFSLFWQAFGAQVLPCPAGTVLAL